MVLANKYQFYLREGRKKKSNKDMTVDGVVYLTKEMTDKTPEGEVMDQLNLTRICCRRHMLTHVDIE
jgi:DNA-directed RNA polymerase I, II, and III subunit RPABC5